jgi:hypothetical protein
MDEVGESLLPVDQDDRNALAITALELLVARDVKLLELERHVRSHLREHASGALAEVAALGMNEDDLMGRGHA